MSRDQVSDAKPAKDSFMRRHGVAIAAVIIMPFIIWDGWHLMSIWRENRNNHTHTVEKPKMPYVDVCFKALEGEELIEVHADWWIAGARTEVYIKLTPDDERAGWYCGELELVRGVAQSYQFLKRHGGPFQDMEVCHMHQSDFDARVCETLRCSDTMCVYVPIVLTQQGEWLNVSVLADYPTPESIYNMPMFR